MKKSILFLLAIVLCYGATSIAQETEEKKFGIKFSGFVKNDFILDSRQIISAREGHFLLYPANVKLDPEGVDINDKSTFNYLTIQTRLTGKITGPDALGAKTSGVIEGAFFGNIADNINSFRLRHAYLKLNWKTTELLMGQTWHIMFATGCFPGTVSFNTGVPTQFFSRNPQIRLTQKAGNFTFTGALATQIDFVSPGGSQVLRNAMLPDLGGQVSFAKDKKLLAGITLGYKQLLPRLETDSSYKASSTIGGITGNAFFKYVFKPITFKIQATYAQNAFDGLMLGGYAVKTITDPTRDYREYTTINAASVWTDIHTNGKKWQAGLFFGFTKNMGSIDTIDEIGMIANYTRGWDIGYVYRISPRVIYNTGKVRFAAEFESTTAGYGDSVNEKAVPQNIKAVVNNRLLIAVFYFF